MPTSSVSQLPVASKSVHNYMYTKIILSNFVLLRVIACSKFPVFKIVAVFIQSFHHGLNTFPDILCISLFILTKYETK
jgi:hypothetical protein